MKSVESKARKPEHGEPYSVNGPGENGRGLTPVNRQRVRYALPGESGLIHPNQNGKQVGCSSVNGSNRGTALLPDERRSPKPLQSGRVPVFLTQALSAGVSGSQQNQP